VNAKSLRPRQAGADAVVDDEGDGETDDGDGMAVGSGMPTAGPAPTLEPARNAIPPTTRTRTRTRIGIGIARPAVTGATDTTSD
jgi:hypothetical protein